MVIVDDALAYQAAGWSVVPCRAGTKLPHVRWRPWQQTPPDVELIQQWWRRWPGANVAVITGRVSGVVVVDVDPRHGGEAGLAQLERDHGDLPWTCVTETPSGGWHVYVAHPGDGRIPCSAGRLAAGVDVRGDGGLVLAPPSRRDGGGYRWAIGGPGALPAMPGVWRELLRPRPRTPLRLVSAPQTPPGPPGGPRDAARLAGLLRTLAAAPVGQRNHVLYWCGCRLAELIDQGAPPTWSQVLYRAGVATGLSPDEAHRTVASALLSREP